MDFLQRRTHLYEWLAIAIILSAGFAYVAYMKWWQSSGMEGMTQESPWVVHPAIDSQYVKKWDTQFYLRSDGKEKYMEAVVQSAVPSAALRVYEDATFVGVLEGKGYYVFPARNDSIGVLYLEEMLDIPLGLPLEE